MNVQDAGHQTKSLGRPPVGWRIVAALAPWLTPDQWLPWVEQQVETRGWTYRRALGATVWPLLGSVLTMGGVYVFSRNAFSDNIYFWLVFIPVFGVTTFLGQLRRGRIHPEADLAYMNDPARLASARKWTLVSLGMLLAFIALIVGMIWVGEQSP